MFLSISSQVNQEAFLFMVILLIGLLMCFKIYLLFYSALLILTTHYSLCFTLEYVACGSKVRMRVRIFRTVHIKRFAVASACHTITVVELGSVRLPAWVVMFTEV